MEVVYEGGGGLDVHAKTVVACLITKGRKEIRTFATMTDEPLQLGDWLSSAGCTHVAIVCMFHEPEYPPLRSWSEFPAAHDGRHRYCSIV